MLKRHSNPKYHKEFSFDFETLGHALPSNTKFPITLTTLFVSNGGIILSYVDENCQASDTPNDINVRAFDGIEEQYDPIVQEVITLALMVGAAFPLHSNFVTNEHAHI